MRDISKIQLTNGEIFNIKDDIARNEINKKKVKLADNIEYIQNNLSSYDIGDLIQTKGFYDQFDYGQGLYLVSNSPRKSAVTLNDGRFLVLLNTEQNIAQYGAKYGDAVKTTEAIKRMIQNKIIKIIIPPLNYETTGNIEINEHCTFEGMDKTYSRLSLVKGVNNNFIFKCKSNFHINFKNIVFWNYNYNNPINTLNATYNDTISDAIIYESGIYVTISDCKFMHWNRALYFMAGYSIDIIRCDLFQSNYGIKFDGENQAININGCGFEFDMRGISLNSGLGNINIFQNQFEKCRWGIEKINTGDISIKNNYFDANTRRDIYLHDGVPFALIDNNYFLDRNITISCELFNENAIIQLSNNIFYNAEGSQMEVYRGSSTGEKIYFNNNLLKGLIIESTNTTNQINVFKIAEELKP